MCAVPLMAYAQAELTTQGLEALERRVRALETTLAEAQRTIKALQTKAKKMSSTEGLVSALRCITGVEEGELNGMKGPHLLIEGCNVHIRSGSGSTDDGTLDESGTLTGLGNLVIGYNETPEVTGLPLGPEDRSGSHNLLIGRGHRFLTFGGFVAGAFNMVSGREASVSGGVVNEASGDRASVSGGENNEASGEKASVNGCEGNLASGIESSISGGLNNEATNNHASVSGGLTNRALGPNSTVSGGVDNEAIGNFSTVSGGADNIARRDGIIIIGNLGSTFVMDGGDLISVP